MSKNKTNTSVKIWDGYGSAFWHVLSFFSFLLLLLSVGTLIFAGLRILYEGFWFVWIILACTGVAGIAVSVFCMNLFPSWGTIVRRIRLSEARMEGAMSVSEINKYEEREDRRNTEIKDKMAESIGKVGRDIKSTQEQVDVLQMKIDAINQTVMQSLKKSMEEIHKDSSRNNQLKDIINDMSSIMNHRIGALTDSIKTLQQQSTIQQSSLDKVAEQSVIEQAKSEPEKSKDLFPEETEKDGDDMAVNKVKTPTFAPVTEEIPNEIPNPFEEDEISDDFGVNSIDPDEEPRDGEPDFESDSDPSDSIIGDPAGDYF